MAQMIRQELSDWPKADHTPKKNANQCSLELEALIVHLCKDDFDASHNTIAKHAASITNEKVSAHLVIRVRERNGLKKETPSSKKMGKIRSSFDHTVSVDVVREQAQHIFGFIQDKTKISYHYHATAQTAAQAVIGLEEYIKKIWQTRCGSLG